MLPFYSLTNLLSMTKSICVATDVHPKTRFMSFYKIKQSLFGWVNIHLQCKLVCLTYSRWRATCKGMLTDIMCITMQHIWGSWLLQLYRGCLIGILVYPSTVKFIRCTSQLGYFKWIMMYFGNIVTEIRCFVYSYFKKGWYCDHDAWSMFHSLQCIMGASLV